MIIKNNPNRDQRNIIIKAIADNGGYCCCALEKTPDTKCMCRAFREQTESGFCGCGLYYKVPTAPIVTLCGSTRFKDDFIRVQKELTLAGYVVISVGIFCHSENDVYSDEAKKALDELHKQKIEMSDMIYVINKGGYIGESTKSEIEWATDLGKEVIYMEETEK